MKGAKRKAENISVAADEEAESREISRISAC
jgi:hypothetical protein